MESIRKYALKIAGVIFIALAVNRVVLYFRDMMFYGLNQNTLTYYLLTASYIVFGIYSLFSKNRYIGLMIGSIAYTLATFFNLYEFTDWLILAGSILLVVVLVMLYKGNPALLQTVWFIPAALVFAGFFIYDLKYGFGYLQFKDLLIYFEPIGLLLICLGLTDLQ